METLIAGEKPSAESGVMDITQTRGRLVPLYWVIMHNDPVTTMDFVVRILIRVFGLDPARAESLMLEIHNAGFGRVALMPLERAEFKADLVHQSARARGFPLACTVEPD